VKPCVIGKSINFREVTEADAEFILSLRTDPSLNTHLSHVENDLEKQKEFIRRYQTSLTDYYFIITTKDHEPIGTIRIYDVQQDSFCWGSWILLPNKRPKGAAIESLLMIFDYGFFGLHYAYARSDVRRNNQKSLSLHSLFRTTVVDEDELNFYFKYTRDQYLEVRKGLLHHLPG